MARFAATIYLLVASVSMSSAATTLSAPTRIKVDADGGYSGIVVKIDKDVPEEECGRILASLKVGLRMNATTLFLCHRDKFLQRKLKFWESIVINRFRSSVKGSFGGMDDMC